MHNETSRPLPGRHRRTLPQRHPLATRIGLMLLASVLFVPVARFLSGGQDSKVVESGGIPGAAISAIIADSSTTTAAPVATAAVTVPETTPATVEPIGRIEAPSSTAVAPVVEAATVAASEPVTTSTQVATQTTVPKPTVAPKATAPATTSAPKATVPNPTVPKSTVPKTTVPKPAVPKTTAAPVVTASPKAVAAPATTVAGRSYGAEEVKAIIRQMWPADSVDKALQVAYRESGYNPSAFNGSCCYGVFQISYDSHRGRLAARGLGRDGLYDPVVNIEIALEIFNQQGWSPWTTA